MINPLLGAGSDLNIGVNGATVVAGNGAGNVIGGDVTAIADQHVGDQGFGGFGGGFGVPGLTGDINVGVNAATVVAGNGVGNVISGDVTAEAHQGVGDYGYHYDMPFGGDINIGVNAATVVAGNGVGNFIGGDVTADAFQHVGDAGFFPVF
jgi:hypothetical protein